MKVYMEDKTTYFELLRNKAKIYLFKDLKKASIITTDEGPFEEDVFWLMMFKIIIMIPQGVGVDKLLNRMQKLSGFRNEEVIKAMRCSDNEVFHIWEKE